MSPKAYIKGVLWKITDECFEGRVKKLTFFHTPFIFKLYSVAPKSDTITCPVIARDSSLARNSRMFATSIGMQG